MHGRFGRLPNDGKFVQEIRTKYLTIMCKTKADEDEHASTDSNRSIVAFRNLKLC